MVYKTVCLYGTYELMTKVLDFLCNHDYLFRLKLAGIEVNHNALSFSQLYLFEEPMYYDGTFEDITDLLPRERNFTLYLVFDFSDVHWNEIKKVMQKYRGSDGLYHIKGFIVEIKEEPEKDVIGGIKVLLTYRPEL